MTSTYLFIAAITLALLGAGLALTGCLRGARWSLLGSTLVCLGKLGSAFLTTGVLPVFVPVDALTGAALGIGILTLILIPVEGSAAPRARLAGSGLLLAALLGLALLMPPPPDCHGYNHTYPYAVAFHLFRRLALACVLTASLWFVIAYGRQKAGARDKSERLGHQGRNLLLLGTVFYLLAEDTGIVWCLRGWADVWRWSPGFMISSAVLIFLMLVFHLPGGYRRGSGWYLLLGGLSGPLLLLAQIIHS
ncbi:MAG TPA: hypothetical protein ENN66_06265 [Proteobacteria bacterium]|nr:hypothetical protein [Pseudomonadota bacterium]